MQNGVYLCDVTVIKWLKADCQLLEIVYTVDLKVGMIPFKCK